LRAHAEARRGGGKDQEAVEEGKVLSGEVAILPPELRRPVAATAPAGGREHMPEESNSR